MSTTPNEGQKGLITLLSRLVAVVNQDVKTVIIIFLLFRMYQVENRVDKRTEQQDKRELDNETFERNQRLKEGEREDKRIKIEEAKLKLYRAKDSSNIKY